MTVTIKDIAKSAGVSYSTVSRALSDHPMLNEATKKKIVEISKQMGYTPNVIARNLVKNTTNTLGVLVPDISNPYSAEVVKGVEDYSEKLGYTVFLCNTEGDIKKESSYINTLFEKRVEGLIIEQVSEMTIKSVKDMMNKVPVVFVGSRSGDEDSSFVSIDNKKAACIATKYLINLGHRNIAFIGGTVNSLSVRDRIEGFTKTLEESGIDFDKDMLRTGNYKRESGYEIARDLILSKKIPTAVLAANDIIAFGVIEAFEGYGYNIPGDVSIIGIDDIEFSSMARINLTTVAEPKYDIGMQAAQMLIHKIRKDCELFENQIVLEPVIKIRGTCRKI